MKKVMIGFALAFVSWPVAPIAAEPPIALPLVRLLVDPWPFVGMRVQVAGYLDPLLNLYLSREHYEMRDSISSILVSDSKNGEISSSDCVNGYVKIDGTLGKTKEHSIIIVNVSEVHGVTAGLCWETR